MTSFYDTSSLLIAQENAFAEPFFISSVTISELEHIKVSDSKSQELKYKARKLVRLLDEHQDTYTVVVDNDVVRNVLEKNHLQPSNDNLILASCSLTSCDVMYSQDLCMRLVGKQLFGLNMQAYKEVEKEETYKGYRQIQMSDSEYAVFLNMLTDNPFVCLVNEYLIVYDQEYDLRDCFRWSGDMFIPAYSKNLRSISMGDKIKAKDEFQRCAIDSMMNNTITAITGRAGSGKSLMALCAAMYLIDSHKYDSLTVLFNPTSTRGAQKMGYYSGSAIEKAKQTSIGHILSSKFGDPFVVDNLLNTGRLKLISMADARGFEVDDHSILWISECQNTNRDLLKLCLQRVSQGAKVFIEGDPKTQVDDISFWGDNNGLARAINVFKGDTLFGYVDLPNIWRSKVAELAEKL